MQLPSNLLLPLAKAGAVHLLAFILLFTSFHSTVVEKPIEIEANTAPVIKATAVSSADVKKIVDAKKKRAVDKAKAEKDRKKKDRQKAERIKAAKKKKIADDLIRKKLADDKKRAAVKKREEDLETKRKADLAKKIKDDAEKKRKADEVRRLQIEKDKKIQAQIDANLRAAKQQRILTEKQKYIALITDKIRRSWIESGRCVVEIKLAPGGLVVDVKVISGEDASCRSAKAAVYKADPLPVSKDSDVFNELRNIRLTLDPQEN